jgi:hypothetical protein
VHVSIVIHNNRWRLGLAEGEPHYDELEQPLATDPVLAVPTMTLEGDATGAPHPDASADASKCSGAMRTASSWAASGIICLKKLPRPSSRRSSMSTLTRPRHHVV